MFAICAYGESPYIRECIDSLLAQTRKTKIIMCAHRTSLFLEQLSREYGIPLYCRDEEADICADWNYAFSMADAKYVTIAHQDDRYEPEYARFVVDKLEKAKSPILCVTDYRPLKNNSLEKDINCKLRHFLRTPLKTKFNDRLFVKRGVLALGNSICCPTVTYNKEKLGDNVFTSPLKYNLDWDTFYILAEKKGSFEYVDKPLAEYRLHDGATSKEFINNHKRTIDDIYMFEKFWPKWFTKILMHFYKEAYKNYDD